MTNIATWAKALAIDDNVKVVIILTPAVTNTTADPDGDWVVYSGNL